MALITINPNRDGYGYFKYKNKLHNIFYGKQGVDLKILKRGFEQVETMQFYYSKVTITFLELHLKNFSKNNTVMSKFMSEFKSILMKKYSCEIGYLWVRERNRASAQHYHLAIMVNGHKCNKGWAIQQIADELWREKNEDGHTYFVTRSTYRLHRADEKEANAAKLRLSYFAKNRTKEINLACKNFSASRLKLSSKTGYTLS